MREGDWHHSDSIQMASYVDDTLPAPERERVEAHLADCPECRRELMEVVAFRRRRSRTWRVGVPAAATAAAAALLLFAGPLGKPEAEAERFRGGPETGGEGVTRIEAVNPGPGTRISTDSARFVWRSGGADVLYRLTLTTESGAVVWYASTVDTAVNLPPDMSLEGNRRYLWYVDAVLPDGRVATTGVRELRTR